MFYLCMMRNITQEWKDKISQANKRTTCNEKFFENIDTEAKAYYLGLFYADGHNNTEKGQIVINLKEEDRKIIERFRTEIEYTGNIGIWKKEPPRQNQCVLAIVSRKLSSDLIKQGCLRQKTINLQYPKYIPKDMERHFIRGFFDGDGSISKSGKYSVNFSIIGTISICEGIANYMSNILQEQVKVHNHKPEKYNIELRCVRISGKKKIKRILDELYKDTDIYLERKYNRYLQYFYIEKLADYELYTSNNHTGYNGGNSKAVIQIDKNGKVVKEWISINEASRNGYDGTCISLVCRGKQNIHKGYKWEYKK